MSDVESSRGSALVVGVLPDAAAQITAWLCREGIVSRICEDEAAGLSAAAREDFSLLIVGTERARAEHTIGRLRALGQIGTLVLLGKTGDFDECRALRAEGR